MLPEALPLLLGLDWLDPEWLLARFGAEFLWVSMLILFVECGFFFPFLPGDTLLFAFGIFIATGEIDLFPGPRLVELAVGMALLVGAGFVGNVSGYEIGRAIGPPLYGRGLLKRQHVDRTHAFFDKHGSKALVIGRFVPFVRTFITVVAGVTGMERRRFLVWSFVGAVLWVLSIAVLGYSLGQAVPWLGHNIDVVIVAILVLGSVPMAWEWRRHRRAPVSDAPAAPGPAPGPAPARTSTPPGAPRR